jgi:ribosome recycling factor
MTVQDISKEARASMTKSIEFYKKQLTKVRTGRASGTMLDDVKVDYYGSPTPLNQVASVSVPDARTIMLQPFDRNTIGDIEKAIQNAGLGLNPQNDGTVIRISVPPLTEERRKDFVKMCKKYAEEGKIAIRGNRKDAMDALKKSEKDKVITEDDKKSGEEQIQKITDEFVKKVDEILVIKEKELMDE